MPTAVPAVADPPEAMGEVEVNPGKVVLMVATFGTERFDNTYGSTGKEIRKNFHGNLTSWERVEGVMQLAPGIASKWELSPDAKTITWTIREGAKFHDGTEITVEDVLWTLQHTMGPQAKEWAKSSPSIRFSGIMERIELGPGPNQVSAFTTVPAPDLPIHASENEGGAGVAQIMPKRSKLHDEKELEAYEANPIGAGPIKLTKHVPLESLFFERHNDFYYRPELGFPTDKRLQFRDLELRLVTEEATRVSAIRTGEADIGRLSLATQKQVEKAGGRLVFSEESVIIESHLWGCWKPQFPCSDKRVRQALNYALDKELIRDRLLGGSEVMELKGWWVITPSTIGYSPELAPWPYDPDKARQLFADAGYKTPDNPDGKDYGKLVLNTYPSGNVPNLIESGRLAVDMWKKELGLDAEVRVYDKVTYGTIRTASFEDFDGQVSWVEQNTRLNGAGIMRSYFLTLQEGGPSTRIMADPELFALVEETLGVMGKPGAEEVFNSTYRRLREESYQITTGYINAPWGVGPRILTWEPFRVAEYASALHTITLE